MGPKKFLIGTTNSQGFHCFHISGNYMISNLLQELAIAEDFGKKFIVLDCVLWIEYRG